MAYSTRVNYKDGRCGWTQYALPDTTHNAVLLEESRVNVEPKLSQSEAKLEPQLWPKRIQELEFGTWRRGLNETALISMLPEYARRSGPVQESALRAHFDSNVWAERMQELSGLTKIDRAKVVRQIEQSLGKADK